MNGVSNITEKILGEARDWAKVHSEEGKAEAEAVQEQYTREAAARCREIREDAQAKGRATDERCKSQADMDRRKSILAAKQNAVESAFEAALGSLAELAEEDRSLLMVRLALKYQDKDAEFIFNQGDQAAVGPAVVEAVNSIRARQQLREIFSGKFLEQIKKLAVSQPQKHKAVMSSKIGSFAGGLIIKEGETESNCTFEVLVSEMREELEGEVSSILFQ